jgi:hypothetical protein
MNLTIKEAYLAMYCMMENFYKITKVDDLGALLGSFNPYLFEGGMPADDAAWDDWKSCVEKVSTQDYLSEKQAYDAMILIIKLYNDKFGFELKEVLIYLEQGIEENIKTWQECCRLQSVS